MTNELEFEAKVVSVDTTCDVYIVGLADDKESPDQYIVLQRSMDETEQDDELGLSTYFLEVCGSDASGYGGIENATLHHDKLELCLRQPSEYLDRLKKIIVHFKLPNQKREDLENQLKLIFHDSDCMLNVIDYEK